MDVASDPWLQSDDLREREFYKYYDPFRALLDNEPAIADIDASDATQLQKPRSSPDAALTAFCQLGALRLNAQRCMVTFFDTQYAYILAEATKTLSLQDDDVHDSQDALWLGFSILERGSGICELTINVPPDRMEDGAETSHSVHIINDLQEDVNFCDSPFVTDRPRARFYAGTPITTPNNVRIGAYCVLDDKPRTGLFPAEVDFLWQMSRTIMSHLEIIRARAELEIGTNMLTGLGSLVRSSSAGLTGRERFRRRPSPTPDPQNSAQDTRSTCALSPKQDEQGPIYEERTTNHSPKRSKEHKTGYSPPAGANARHVRRGANQRAGDDVQEVFQTAADLLKIAVEVDGTMFLDASINAYGGAVGSGLQGGKSDSFANRLETTNANEGLENGREADTILCKVLGLATSTGDHAVPALSENFLKTLLDQYPRGKVWNFGPKDGSASSEYVLDASETADINSISNLQVRTDRTHNKHQEAEELQRLFPGARSLCLVGMWDAIRERWFGGSLVWTYSRSRVFSNDTELVFLIAFNDVLMAEVTRLEAALESKAKSDFISSISHELRSPLQGILCGIDLLTEQKSADLPILSQIEMCSTTLLEVINHLLDFSKINNLSGKLKSPLDQVRRRNSVDIREMASGNVGDSSTETYSYARITEEICDSMFYSHCYSRGLSAGTKLDLILDISMDASVQSIADVGAWKRICINVINNALKYTDEGYVAASLRKGSQNNGRPLAVFSVVDTGCGMSPEFLNRKSPRYHLLRLTYILTFNLSAADRLFRPFEQEDDLSQGTGLGMSLVSKLIDSLGGNVEVQSLKNYGTTITISVPLDDRIQQQADTAVGKPCQDVRIGFVESIVAKQDQDSPGRKLLRTTFERTCERLGAEITSSEGSAVQMIFEADFQALEAGKSSIPMIVLCDSFVSAHRLRKSFEIQEPSRYVECIAQPYGPIRLANAIQACVQATENSGAGDGSLRLENLEVDQSSVAASTAQSPQRDQAGSAEMYDGAVVSPSEKLQLFNAADAVSKSTGQSNFDEIYPVKYNDERSNGDSLPRRPNQHLRRSSTMLSDEEPQSATDRTDICLLLVDDNSVNLKMLVAYADKYGYHRLTAVNGQEAVEAYGEAIQPSTSEEHSNDATPSGSFKTIVILLDINMPVMDGFEAARRIRQIEKRNSISPARIIAVTGLGSAESRQKAHASGMDIFLTKPVRPRELTSVLASIFDSKAG